MNGLVRKNRILARRRWCDQLCATHLDSLDSLTAEFDLSIALGDLLLLQGKWYVTNAGLLRLAHRSHCGGIVTQQIREFCDASIGRWVFKAVVYRTSRSRGFVGFGDADPSNVAPLVRGAEMRMAETRAVNRALRKAYGIGLCSVEEIGCTFQSREPACNIRKLPPQPANGNGAPKLRDQLCLLIRQ